MCTLCFFILWSFASQAVIVLGSEYIVDWIKHCFILKFNGIRADIYSKFTTILCHDILNSRKEVCIRMKSTVSTFERWKNL
jgi:hypothetical protein